MTAGAGAFAIVGMAAVFAGAARAPFTAILIVFEMTNDYSLILPLMAAVIVSMLVAERLHSESIYTLKLALRGIHLRSGRDVDVMESVRVSDVMLRQLVTVNVDTLVTVLAEKFIETGRHGFAVLDHGGDLFGIVSLADYRDAMEKNPTLDGLKVGDIASRAIITVYPDETVGAALQRMAPRDLSRLPVVERENPRHLIGMVRRNDIVRAYEIGVTNREESRLHAHGKQIRDASGFVTTQVRVEENSPCDGHRVADVPWPENCIIAAVRRRGKSIIPHGDYMLRKGDVIVAVTEGQALQSVRDLCSPDTHEKSEL
jgi:CIC family chloride channel protein